MVEDRAGTKGPPLMGCDTTIYRLFDEQVRQRPDAPLFELPGGRTLGYRDTADIVHRIAARLRSDGVVPGDRVAMQVSKSPEAIALYLATLQLGGIFLPLNTAYTGAEMRYFIGDAQPRVLVCAPDRASDYSEYADSLVLETLGDSADGSLLSGTERDDQIFDATSTDPAAILYTSGTTGRSKGAVLTHGNLATNCEALLEAWQFTSDDRLIHALPIFHVHGLFVAGNITLAAGASMHFLPKFDADAIIELLPRATVLMGVPTFYTRLANSEKVTPELCSSMRLFISGSAPLLASDHEAFSARTGHFILERYGMTETGMNSTNPYDGGPRKPGTVGKPLSGTEIRIVDRDTGTPLPDGDVGSIEVRGPNVFTGYWQMPEKTASEFRADGFFVTGDLGRFDEDGYLCIVGRDKDLVISGGYNIYPIEIEKLLDSHPSVLESAVIGVPHPDFGETVVAVVVPIAGAEPRDTELMDHIVGELARFKHPRAVRVVDALPRNVMGKVQKAELRKQYADLFSGGDSASELPISEFAFPGPLRDKLVGAILDGTKSTTSSLLIDYADEPLPVVGQRRRVVASDGTIVCVIETVEVRTVPLGMVDLQHAIAEGEGFSSVEQWRTNHETFWSSSEYLSSLGVPSLALDDRTLVVTERFRLC